MACCGETGAPPACVRRRPRLPLVGGVPSVTHGHSRRRLSRPALWDRTQGGRRRQRAARAVRALRRRDGACSPSRRPPRRPCHLSQVAHRPWHRWNPKMEAPTLCAPFLPLESLAPDESHSPRRRSWRRMPPTGPRPRRTRSTTAAASRGLSSGRARPPPSTPTPAKPPSLRQSARRAVGAARAPIPPRRAPRQPRQPRQQEQRQKRR